MGSDPPPPRAALVPASARLLRRNKARAILSAVLAFAGTPLLVALTHETGLGLFAAAITYLGALGLLQQSLTQTTTFLTDGRRLRIEDDALWAGDERLCGRGEIAQAFVSTRENGGAILRLQTKRGAHRSMPWTIALATEAEGTAILAALSLDASRSVASYRAGSRVMLNRRLRNLGLGLFALATTLAFVLLSLDGAVASLPAFIMGPLTLLGTMGAMLALSLALIWPSRILVGPDGVVLEWLRLRRKIPLGDIESVHRLPGALHLELRSGERIELAYPAKPTPEQLEATLKQGIISGPGELDRAGRRIEEALAAHRRGQATEPAPLLERGTRGSREWLKQLLHLSRGAQEEQASYRRQVVEPDKLWTLVENPAMTPTARVGAAVALSGTLDEAGRARLRVAAEASALPGVKGALAALSQHERADDDELAALLDAAAEDEDAVVRRKTR